MQSIVDMTRRGHSGYFRVSAPYQVSTVMQFATISLLYTTARPHLIASVVDRWLMYKVAGTEMLVVTDEPIDPAISREDLRYIVNRGRRDCVTGWNLAARHSCGDILVQVSDDLFPPLGWMDLIKGTINHICEKTSREDIVLNLLDERKIRHVVYHPVLTRAAYNKVGFIYPPEFESMFCDHWFCAFHRKYSHYEVSNELFWSHRHHTTHRVEIDEVMMRHESPERYAQGLETLKKYLREHDIE